MGLDFEYRAGSAVHRARPKMSDLELLYLLGQEHNLAADVSAIADTSELGTEATVSRDRLVGAIGRVLEVLRGPGSNLPYVYGVEYEMPGVGKMRDTGGGVGGIRIKGECWFLDMMEPGRCEMQRLEEGPDGTGVVVETRDVRKERSIATDNLGVIKIHRQKRLKTLMLFLTELNEFARGVDAAEIVKVVS